MLDLAKALECVCLPVVGAWATHFNFTRKILRVQCGYFEHQRLGQFEGCVAEPLQTITAVLLGSIWSCLLLCIVLQNAPSEVMKVDPLLKLKVFVDDITAFMEGRNKKLSGIAEKVLKSRKRRREEQSQCVMQPLGREVSGMQQERRGGSCDPRLKRRKREGRSAV